jgi:nucleotide-binding universal stress UspA family protein
MNYASLLVHLDLGHPNTARVRIAADLAQRMRASVTGIAICQPLLMIYNDGCFPADLIEQDRRHIDADLKTAEAEFRAALGDRIKGTYWRPIVTSLPLAAPLANEARCADLVITGPGQDASVFDASRHLDIGDFVMRAGRPCLILPEKIESLALDHVLVGWKDTVASRRAVSNALPLLRQADRVTIVEIAPEEDLNEAAARVHDVAFWLNRHGIEAASLATPSTGDDAARLDAIIQEQAADLLVAGAYGHSRFREWVLGGVTRDLLLRAGRPVLVSH